MEEATDLTIYTNNAVFFESHNVGFLFNTDQVTFLMIGDEEDQNLGITIKLDEASVQALEAGLLSLHNVLEGHSERRLN